MSMKIDQWNNLWREVHMGSCMMKTNRRGGEMKVAMRKRISVGWSHE